MFAHSFFWPIADAARCGRPSGCRSVLFRSRFPSRRLRRLAIAPKLNRGAQADAFAPGRRPVAERAGKSKSAAQNAQSYQSAQLAHGIAGCFAEIRHSCRDGEPDECSQCSHWQWARTVTKFTPSKGIGRFRSPAHDWLHHLARMEIAHRWNIAET